MSPSAEFYCHQRLAGVIDDVLRCRSGPIRVPELALSAGFSRFHLARLFHQTTEETLQSFLRRIRLERSACMLLRSDKSVLEIAVESGYLSPESFARSFRAAYGASPTQFRKDAAGWKLAAPSDLHWNADYVPAEDVVSPWEETVIAVPLRFACVWRAVGNYARLDEAWWRLQEAYGPQIPGEATFVTVYLDNMWNHPVCATMRADVGWLCPPCQSPPPGMRLVSIASGCYATSRFVLRTERNDAWSYMSGRYVDRTKVCYDEYDRFPIPFEDAKTRMYVGQVTS